MQTEQYQEDDLPWGAAAIPEWWIEVTPHNVMDYREIERELRRELARMGLSPPPTPTRSDDGGLVADTGAGPFSLPGFIPSDGITDASFISPGDERWYITSDGFFYSREDPDVRYTPSQMVESGHLPPGMDSYFEEGWDRSRALSSPTGGLYARSENAAWERPDWLKKKLRSTDQGIALRGESGSEPPSPSGSNHGGTRTPSSHGKDSPSKSSHSKSPVPAWMVQRQQILKDKAEAEEVILAPPDLGQAVGEESVSSASTIPPWKRKQAELAADDNKGPSVHSTRSSNINNASTSTRTSNQETTRGSTSTRSSNQETTRGRSGSPEWKKKQRAMNESRSVSPMPTSGSRSKKTDDAAAEDAPEPEWKKKRAAMARSRSSSPTASAIHKSEEEGSDRTSKGSATEDPALPAWKKKHAAMARSRSSSPTASTIQKKPEEGSNPTSKGNTAEDQAVPAWKKKQAAMVRSRSASPTASTLKKEEEDSDPTTKGSTTEDQAVPTWKKKQVAMTRSRSSSPTASTLRKKEVEGSDPTRKGSTAEGPAVPAWKTKQAAMARSRSSSPTASTQKKEDEDSDPSRMSMKKQYEEATAKPPVDTSEKPVPSRGSRMSQYQAATVKQAEEASDKPLPGRGNKVSQYEAATATAKAEDDGDKPVPGIGGKKSAYESAMAQSRSNSPVPPTRHTSKIPAWKKKAEETSSSSTPAWKKPQAKVEEAPAVPAWKLKQQEAAEARAKEEEARKAAAEARAKEEGAKKQAAAEARAKEEEAKKQTEEAGDPRRDEASIKLNAQGFALKLLDITDDAARAKELRNTIAPTKENNHKVLVKPDELLTAIAHHAQIWKNQDENKEKINGLRQVAIIARLVIMKLYGANSTELIQFQEGLRPAFA